MQNEFRHTPFSALSEKMFKAEDTRNTSNISVASSEGFQSDDTPATIKKQKSHSQSENTRHAFKKPKKATYTQSQNQEQDDTALFLHAVYACKEDLQPTKGGARKAKQKGKHKAQGKLQSATVYVDPKVNLDDVGLFSKLMEAPMPKKNHGRKKLAQPYAATSIASTSHRVVQEQKHTNTFSSDESLTMQELLDTQRSVGLENEEAMDAFFKAMKDVEPLMGKGRDIAPEVQPNASVEQGQDAFALMMEKRLEFSLALKGEYIEGHVVGLDELTMNNLRAGVYSPEAHLDLHGLNAMQAYQALVGFFKRSWYKGMRTILLIPGRGKNSPNGVSVLREKVQLWLTQDPFKRVVLAFCTAQPLDGGPGTLYVLLRKYKKKGKICWERMPSDPDLY